MISSHNHFPKALSAHITISINIIFFFHFFIILLLDFLCFYFRFFFTNNFISFFIKIFVNLSQRFFGIKVGLSFKLSCNKSQVIFGSASELSLSSINSIEHFTFVVQSGSSSLELEKLST
jgi:hypothetical protein